MQDFYYSVPTKVFFGKGVAAKVGELARRFGTKAMVLHYGDGVVEKIGLYDIVINSLKENGVDYVELKDIRPNPRISKVDEGVSICRKEGVKVLIPLGGGSCTDTAKGIASCVNYDGPAWDVVLDSSLAKDNLPVIAIPTIAATGSDMDSDAMLCNEATNDKMSLNIPAQFPAYSLLDPTYTCTVPRRQTAAGTADIMSHIMEVYFSKTPGAFFPDRIMEAMLKTCVKYGTIACCEDTTNYEARANLLWAASWGCNGFFDCGKIGRRWSVHPMEHQLGAYYDETHGIGIAILTPHWMRYILNDDTKDMFATFGMNVLGLSAEGDTMITAKKAIDTLEELFHKWGIPKNLRESGIGITDKSKFEIMAEKALGPAGRINGFVPLDKKDVINIYDAAY
ncbi:MAG: iron-containing alcohol dehydrogenase [Bacillota bacterium]|jgi:alcohol dehydrogenase YqhD (iron-dependent ADH family)